MTDRRPDVNCTGCGTYCHSLSPTAKAEDFPTAHFCDKCLGHICADRRSIAMLNYAWYVRTGEVEEQFKLARKLRQPALDKIRSFCFTMRNEGVTGALPFDGDPLAMSVSEWKKIAQNKLALYRRKQKPSQKNIDLLRAFIRAA